MRHLHLNIVPIEIPDVEINVGVLPFESRDSLKQLRQKHVGTHVFKRGRQGDNDIIHVVALDGSACSFAPKTEQLPAIQNLGLVRALLEEYFVRSFHGKREILGYQPLEILTKESEYDFLGQAAKGHVVPPWLCVRLSHRIEVRSFSFERQKPFVGLVLNQRSYRRIGLSCADWLKQGLDLAGLYVVEKVARSDPRFSPNLKLVGRVARTEGDTLHLGDYREERDSIGAADVQLEADFTGFFRCLSSLFGSAAASIDDRLFDLQTSARGGSPTLGEIARVSERLSQKKLELLPGLTVNAVPHLNERRANFPVVKTCPPALLVFDPTFAKPATPNKLEILTSGPYSQRGFSPTKPKICVVCQRGRKGEVEQFLRKFFEGVADSTRKCYFLNGFIKTYRLSGYEARFFLAENTTAAAYRKAVQEALQTVESDDQRWNLALVQVDESSHELHGENNPYLVAKASFLAQQIPVQVFESETMAQSGVGLDFVLSNMALASYAKLGGTPWHLQVDRAMAHELVIGLGSASISDSRLGSRQRVVGITTLFTGEGRYMLGNLSKVVPFEEYRAAVTEMLQSAMGRAQQEMNWQKGDEVRLIFHSFKPLKDDEAEAVKVIAKSLARDFQVDFAFLHVAQDQPLVLIDSEENGAKAFGGRGLKGAFTPKRGTYVALTKHETLLTLVGPAEVKKPTDGLPSPLILRLHRSSTFHDMEYLTKQVFNFSCHSWRSFNAAGMPVTILYSQLIARLLGRLGALPHFSTDSIIGRLNRLRWFL